MSATLSVGQLVVGRYRIDAVIGEGGFGTVYRANELRLERAVALKVLRPEILGRGDAQTRFAREAQLAKRLEHPNTVRLIDFGTTENGVPFIVYELLRGQPLDQVIDAGGPMPPERVARIATQVLKSLMEAHGQGIVHRDIKPSNIFLCAFTGEKDFVKVLDFGIAKAEGASHTALTAAGVALGTPAYMAPEQVRGSGVGSATDLYALGLVMGEMLVGTPIVHADTPAMMAIAQLSDDPVALPDAVTRSPLARIIARATDKSLSRRYASAADMLADLEALALPTRASGGSSAVIHATPDSSFEMSFHDTAAVHHASLGAAPSALGRPPAQLPSPGPGWTAPSPAAPLGYGPPPGMAPPPVRMPEAPRSSGGLIAAVIAFGGLLVIVTVVALVFLVRGRADTGSDPQRGDPVSGPTSGGTRIEQLDGAALERRLTGLGYTISGQTNSSSEMFTLSVFQLRSSDEAGAVQLYHYADASMAELVAEQLAKNPTPGAVMERGGHNILFVYLVSLDGGGADTARSKRLLDRLTRP